jgi:hypothetical protein
MEPTSTTADLWKSNPDFMAEKYPDSSTNATTAGLTNAVGLSGVESWTLWPLIITAEAVLRVRLGHESYPVRSGCWRKWVSGLLTKLKSDLR